MQEISQKMRNISISQRDQLMSTIRDKVNIKNLYRISSGVVLLADVPLIQYLASIVILDLHIESGISNEL